MEEEMVMNNVEDFKVFVEEFGSIGYIPTPNDETKEIDIDKIRFVDLGTFCAFIATGQDGEPIVDLLNAEMISSSPEGCVEFIKGELAKDIQNIRNQMETVNGQLTHLETSEKDIKKALNNLEINIF